MKKQEAMFKEIFKKGLLVKGYLSKNLIKTYWWNTEKNFGDLLVPLLLKSYDLTPIHTSRNLAEAVCIGSVLQWLDEDYCGYIVGCGLMFDKHIQFPYAKILALRGELTRQRLGASKNTVLGDPGLLVDKFIAERQKKKFVIGFIPHWKDKNDKRIEKIFKKNPNDILIIDVQRDPQVVITEIDQCEAIFSSSLHGLVTADALNIPNAWLLLSEKTTGTFKFFDYGSAFGENISPLLINGDEKMSFLIDRTRKVNPKIDKIKFDLDKTYNEFSSEVHQSRGRKIL